MDKNFLTAILVEAIKQSKGDWGRNQYLLKRIKQNKEIINSDRRYLEKISGLKIPEIMNKEEDQYQKILNKDKSVSLISDLVKCTICNKEIKMDEKSARHRNFWYHESCYKTISEKKHKQEKIKIEKSQKNIIVENINLKITTQKL
ncbi:MAG: glycosyl transferase, partial [Thaumarchaeota archaeon]|nr:glycosyl transferase [Nitrososphaerota archaeon]